MKNNGKMVSGGLGLSPRTVGLIKHLLVSIFQYAVDNRLLAEHPVTNVKIPSGGDSSATSLTVEEANAFVSVKDQVWFGNAFVFQLHTGLRNQELLALIWDDVDFQNGTLRVERACKWINGNCVEIGCTKTGRSNRVIELEAEQLELLQLQLNKQQAVISRYNEMNVEYGEEKIADWIKKYRSRVAHLYTKTNLIFPARAGNVPSVSTPRREFKMMLRSAGLTDRETNIRWYDLRHTHASILLTAGVPEHEVAERLGHSTETLRTYYTHVLNNRRRIASRVIANLIRI